MNRWFIVQGMNGVSACIKAEQIGINEKGDLLLWVRDSADDFIKPGVAFACGYWVSVCEASPNDVPEAGNETIT